MNYLINTRTRLALLTVLLAPIAGRAQNQEGQTQTSNLEQVTVIGSRNPKRSAVNSAVPVDVIPLKQISNQVGQLDLTQLLTYLAPSFNSVRQTLATEPII